MNATFRVRTADHWRLEVEHIPASSSSRAGSPRVALLGHAMMVDRRSLDRPRGRGFASELAAAGWDVYSADLRGRGRSSPRARDGARWTYDDLVRHDLPALASAVAARHPDAPLFVVGHSLTSHVSVAAAGCGRYTRPPDGHVLIAGNIWMPHLEPSRWRRARKASSIATIEALLRALGRVPSRELRVGPVEESAPYWRQMVAFWRRDRWGSEDGEDDYLQGMARVRGPVLAVLGAGDDLLAHPEAASAWLDRFGASARVERWVVARDGLTPGFDPDHMGLVTDERSRPLWRAIADWMNRTVDNDRDRDRDRDRDDNRDRDPPHHSQR